MLAKKKLLGEFRIGRTIGEGAFSKVKLATHKVTEEKVAIKIIRKEEEKKDKHGKPEDKKPAVDLDSSSPLASLSKEVKLLMRLNHPNVINLHSVIDTETELFIIMEYVSGGELIDYIAAKGSLPEKESRRIFRQLVSAIDHCHSAGVIHRDLKLENMLLSPDKNLKLSDFGLGRTVNGNDHYLNTFCGTPLYAAPELVSGTKYIGPSADIWSLGVVLYIMVAGRPPFKCETIAELYQQIKSVKYSCPPGFSPELKTLLAKILVRDPVKRATIDEVRADPWLNQEFDGPPERIPPHQVITADSAKSKDLEQLVFHVSKHEDSTVYYFRKQDWEESEDYHKEKEAQAQAQLTPTPVVPVQPAQVAALAVAPNSVEAPVSGYEDPRRRRSSITTLVSRLMPFQAMSKSTPVSPTENAAFSKPVNISPSSTSGLDGPQPNKGRRHSTTADISALQQQQHVAKQQQATLAPPTKLMQPLAHQRRRSVDIPSGGEPVMGGQSVTRKSATIGGSSMMNSRTLAPSMTLISENEEDEPQSPTSESAKFSVSSVAKPHAQQAPSMSDMGKRRMSVLESFGFGSRSGYSDEIRSVRFSTSLVTTTQFSPREIAMQLESILGNTAIFQKMDVEKRSKYIWVGKIKSDLEQPTVIEIEIVKVWLLNMSAVKTKRLGGDALVYKETFQKLSRALNW